MKLKNLIIFLILMFITNMKFTHDESLSYQGVDRLDDYDYQVMINSSSELPDDIYWMLPKIY